MNKPAARLPILLLLCCFDAPQAAPAWVVDAADPGPDTPPAGQSRFDQLYRDAAGGYRIPYPFDSLIEDLESRTAGPGEPAVRQVFVPVGRSLQRNAPAPDYFRYPRRVIAVDGEPVTAANDAGLVMKYRLFVAHQPRTENLEIISYNDTAGRFEFQLVEGYDGRQQPRAKPVRRVMCLSCHQNAAPIFAARPWSETSFNVAVAQRLAEALPDRFASAIEVLSLDAGVIDLLAEHANYLAAAQLVWRRGCITIACRAALLRAVLQYRLSGDANFERQRPEYRRDYFAELARNWSDRWPRGLALPASRIADRDPFAPGPGRDPLLPRPPQATWQAVDEVLAAGIVFRLGGFFTLEDIRRLDRRLIGLAGPGPKASIRYRADCRADSPAAGRLRLACGGGNDRRQLRATLEIETGPRGITDLLVLSLQLPRDPDLWQPRVVIRAQSAGGVEARFGDLESGLSPRLANGDRLVSMSLNWERSPGEADARLEIRVSPEFRFIDAALGRLRAAQARSPAGSLAGEVFNRQSILQPLTRELGMKSRHWPAPGDTPAIPLPRVTSDLRGALALLQPYCAHCHAGGEPNPPGFLSARAPASALARCAPRMLARLQLWSGNPNPPRSPMPPPASIAFSGTNASQWPSSDHFRSLVSSLENLARETYGAVAADGFGRADYDALPSCVAAFSE